VAAYRDPQKWSQIWQTREGEFDPKARIPDMDYEGIDAACVFGAFSLVSFLEIDDPPFAAELAKAMNDWGIDEYCGVAPERLKYPGVLPLQDVNLAVKEIYRLKQKGAVGIQVWPHFKRVPLHDPRFEPIWAAAEEVDLPICIHACNYMGYGPESTDIHFFKHAFLSWDMVLACTSFVGYGILEKHPKLRVGFFESMASWAMWLADRLDEHYGLWAKEVPWLSRSPREWMLSENCYYSAQAVEISIPQFMQVMNPKTIGFNSDYSHGDGASPDSVKLIYTRKDLSDEQKRLVLGENSARFYKIPLKSYSAAGR
jgi:predicted TIM-barrel fold metal-dependent hydrolase